MKETKQAKNRLRWIGRAFLLAICFAGTYVLLQWDVDAPLALVIFIMPLFGFLAGILVALLRKKLDWWYCAAMGLGFLLAFVVAFPQNAWSLLPANALNCLWPCGWFALTGAACSAILRLCAKKHSHDAQ